MIITGAWIRDGWVCSHDAELNEKYWIDEKNWIWGPVGAADMDTHHWIKDGWIWGPDGAADIDTGFYIKAGFIYGPRLNLPFIRG